MNIQLEPLTFKVSLALEAHGRAQQFQRHQSRPRKAKQVYLNTLAVYAVNFYLQCLGFETDLEQSDSWEPIMQTLMDVADLEVKNYGKLECRPVLPGAESVYLPAEAWYERIGYIAVQLDESLREATLLGFAEKVETEELPLERLQSLENLPEYLNQFRQTKQVNLSKWLEDIFEAGWQTLEEFVTPKPGNLALAFRGAWQPTVKGAKLIDLGVQLGNQPVALLMALTSEEEEKVGICVQVHPAGTDTYLPPNFRLALLSQSGETIQEVPSRSFDNFIQLPRFKCDSGEQFSIQVALDDLSITENFVV
ncbi:MAG: DUF1822 family protein [Symploca sp. SIO2C1]|nr:DUF1822 family protein [Symploca sp. SIO2C1]